MAEVYLVEFNGSRKEFFYNTYYHSLSSSEYVIVQAEQGEDMGIIMQKVGKDVNVAARGRPRSILRPAGTEDISHWDDLRNREKEYKTEVIGLIGRHGLSMKVVDAECQFDGSKITFFFTAESRVDFRSLVRDLASKYKTRIELRQIGVRDEARRVGGYGICGLQQCCSSHLREFAPVTTQHAREQDLSLNPSKISGNCGRLLCCLRFEVSQYVEVKKKYPAVGSLVRTEKGNGVIDRIDVFSEQAIVRNEEGVFLKVSADEIIETRRASGTSSENEQTRRYDARDDSMDNENHNDSPEHQ